MVTCPEERDNRPKGLLIPRNFLLVREEGRKAERRFGRGLRPIS